MTTVVETRYRVGGMDCASCATKIETAVRRLPYVKDVTVSATAGILRVRHDDDGRVDDLIKSEVARLGYSVSGNSQPEAAIAAAVSEHTPSVPWWASAKGRLTLACGLAVLSAWLLALLVPGTAPWGFILAMSVGLLPIARRAFSAARAGMPFTIETLMTIAAVGAVLINSAEEAAAVVFLFLVGELLEGVAAGRARASIASLTQLIPSTALIEAEGGAFREIPAATLSVGAIIMVRPGDRIAADGEIVDGNSDIDEAPVTGESTPKRKSAGYKVFAGTINQDGTLRVRVTAAAADNTIARIVKLVEEAQEAKAPTERFIDRFAFYYTPAVLALGALVALVPPMVLGGTWSEWTYKGLAILLIGCPCALVISTPAAIAAGLANGARRGLLMKGGTVLESLRTISMIAFDKTGTLTEGKPQVTDVVAFNVSKAEVIGMAGALEAGSSHPLAKAILAHAASLRIDIRPADEAGAISGKGVVGNVGGVELFLGSAAAASERVALTSEQQATIEQLNGDGKSIAVLVAGGDIAGIVAMRDEPRADAARAIAVLKARGIGAVMLTGDNPRTAEAIAASLGLTARAGLLPEDKLRIIGELQQQGQRVAQVGDGINDAPALAAADIGIAMGGGTDVALETADAAILHGRVMDVAAMIDLSRSTMRNIGQNVVVSLGLKAVFLVTTLIGVTGLWPAILADTGATVLVTLNALRLLQVRSTAGGR